MAYQNSVIIWKRNLAASVAVMALLAGCGGSSGGGSGDGSGDGGGEGEGEGEETIDELLENPDVGATFDGVAQNAPVHDGSSVTQSSNDQATAKATFSDDGAGNILYTVTNSVDGTEEWSVNSVDDQYEEPEPGDKGRVLEKKLASGEVLVAVGTDADLYGESNVPGADYLAAGAWIYTPASNTGNYETGVFVDGNDPFTPANIAGLSGTASYAGKATGLYTEDPEEGFDIFDADVSLSANFDTNKIDGRVHTFTDDALASIAGSLVLDAANIDTTAAGDPFDGGTISGTYDGETYGGNWSGQFYGNGANAADNPVSVGGVFGANETNGDGALIGAFVAEE